MGQTVAEPGGGYTEEFTFAFSSEDGWTELNGSWFAAGGIYYHDDLTANAATIYTADELASVDHYIIVEYDAIDAASYDGVILRSPNSTYGPRYTVRYDQANTDLHFRVCGNGVDSHSCNTFHTSDQTISAGNYLAVSVEGTNTSTEFKVWINPSGTDPDDWGAAGITVNSGNWVGAPGTYCDTGKYVGLYSGSGSSLVVDFDNLRAGAK